MAKTLTVYLAADLKNFNSGMAEAETRTEGLGGKLNGMLGPALIAAGIAAAAFATRIGVEGVKAAIEDEKALTALNTTLGNLGFGYQATEVDTFLQGIARVTGEADDKLRPAFDRLIRSTGDLGEAQNALKIAMDISAGTGKSLDQVVQALGKAYDGNTTGLSRLGVGIDKATLATGDMQQITKSLSTTFAGQAQAAAQTYEGQLKRIENTANEAKETIGYALLDALDRVTVAFGGPDGLNQSLEDTANATANVITGIGLLSSELIRLIPGLQTATDQSTDFGDTIRNYFQIIGIAIPPVRTIALGIEKLGDAGAEAAKKTRQQSDALKVVTDSYGSAYQGIAAYQRGTFAASRATQEMTADTDNLSRALVQLEGKARQAASAWASAYGPVLTALLDVGAVDEFWKRVSKLDIGAAPKGSDKVVDNLRNVGGAATQAADEVSKAQQKMYDAADTSLKDWMIRLDEAVGALDQAQQDVKDWADKMQGTLLSAFDIGAAYKASITKNGAVDGQAWIKGLTEQINKLDWFGNVLTELQRRNAPVELIEYLRSQGVDAGGAMGQAMIDQGIIPEIIGMSAAANAAAGNLAAGMVPAFLLETEGMAAGAVEQLATQVAASKTQLVAIGKAIGKPVGAGFAAEIADAVADALDKANRTRSAQEARRAAEQAAQRVTGMTDQQVGQGLQRVINNSNARAGLIGNPFGLVLG